MTPGTGEPSRNFVVLGKHLRGIAGVSPLGVYANVSDYPEKTRRAMLASCAVCHPGPRLWPVLEALGKRVFPRGCYAFMGDKARQADLFSLLGIPHPKTLTFRGKNRAARILAEFAPPFVAKTPRGSGGGAGVWKIEDEAGLSRYLFAHPVALIQEWLPVECDVRVVVTGGEAVHAYRRVPKAGDFRANVAQGARIALDDVPAEGVAFAVDAARRCRFDDAGLDVCRARGRWHVLETNMVYGREGFRAAGLDLRKIYAGLLARGVIPGGGRERARWRHLRGAGAPFAGATRGGVDGGGGLGGVGSPDVSGGGGPVALPQGR